MRVLANKSLERSVGLIQTLLLRSHKLQGVRAGGAGGWRGDERNDDVPCRVHSAGASAEAYQPALDQTCRRLALHTRLVLFGAKGRVQGPVGGGPAAAKDTLTHV